MDMAGLSSLKFLLLSLALVGRIQDGDGQTNVTHSPPPPLPTSTPDSARIGMSQNMTSSPPITPPAANITDSSLPHITTRQHQPPDPNTSEPVTHSPPQESPTNTPDSARTGMSQNMTSSPPITPPADLTVRPASQCTYSVEGGKDHPYSVRVNISNPDGTTYNVTLDEHVLSPGNNQSFNEKIQWNRLRPNSTHNIKVTPNCKGNGSFHTEPMNENDEVIKEWKDRTICYMTKWALGRICFNVTNETSCTSNTLKFDGNISKVVIIPLADPPQIKHTRNLKTFEVQFEWEKKPPNCRTADLRINCFPPEQDSDTFNQTIDTLSPSKNYSCTIRYGDTNQTIHVPEVKCGLSVNNTVDVTSITFTLSSNCSLESNRMNICSKCHNRSGTSPRVICQSNSTVKSTLRMDNLQAFVEYHCSIVAYYNNTPYQYLVSSYQPNITTKSGNPDFGEKLSVSNPSHNSIKVTCNKLDPMEWKGPVGTYHASLFDASGTKVGSKTENSCSFEFENLSYLAEYTVKVRVKNGANSYSVTREQIINTKYNDKAVIGILVLCIILTSLALLFVLHKIYILRKSRSGNDELLNLLPVPDSIGHVEPISANELLDTYKRKSADEGRIFLAEFQSIPRIFSNYTIKEAKRTENTVKNRYVDILPYDYNRVHLTSAVGHDYINASFIEGFKEPKKYIAAQGPKDETIWDFWEMVWEQQSSIIVMVTRCEEGNRNKCSQYWPSMDRQTEIFKDFVVKIKSENVCPDYIIRHLTLSHRKDKAPERDVTHIQFTSWPDHGVPGDPHLLLKLRRRVNAFKNFFSGPIVVHCSAGVGRTGTYIGIDAMMESLDSENRVDIYGFVVRLRRQRCLMVQVEAQYTLIHQALLDFNQFGETEISLAELHSTMSALRESDSEEEPSSLLQAEFQRLPSYNNWRQFNVGLSEENVKKNRCTAVIPYDFNRVLLKVEEDISHTSEQEEEEEEEECSSDEDDEEATKYINASHIDSYWRPRSLIVAQGPVPETVADFLHMIYQKKVRTVVMLTDCTENGKELCSQYWGDERLAFGEMAVEVKECKSFPTYIRRHLEIWHTKRKAALHVQQYHFLKWFGRDLPENPQELTDMWKGIKEQGDYDNSSCENTPPIVVHCSDGSSRSGIFCALWNVLDSACTEKLIDIFQAVKALRKARQGMVTTFDQYDFLYRAVEGVFPIQNGGLAPAGVSAEETVHIENEETGQISTPASTAEDNQQVAVPASQSTENGSEEPSPEQEAESGNTAPEPTEEASESNQLPEKAQSDGPTNGPVITLEA